MSKFRQLAAILFADVVGYTKLMQHDETAALDKLHHFKKELNEKIAVAGGQIIQYYGDGCLAIFNQPTAALTCAKLLQELFRERHKIPVRIGIHLGEFIVEDGNIYGDSVNIASRIQSMSVPGGVLFSDAIRQQVRNKPEFAFKSLGMFEFKNVDEPMEVFALSNEGFPVPLASELQGKFKTLPLAKPGLIKKIRLAAAVLAVTGLGLTGYVLYKNASVSGSDKSVAVLAFTDMSPDKSQEYLGDGLAEDIITSLSKIRDLKVIARTSSFQFKGKNTDLREIGEKLDVAAVLEGSVQKSGDKIRVTAQLIDARDGAHIWSHKWDREYSDIFLIQDEIAASISEKLKVTLLRQPGRTDTKVNPEAYEMYLQARQLSVLGRPLNQAKAKELLLKSMKLDSTYSGSYAFLSIILNRLANTFPPADSLAKKLMTDSIRILAERAIRLDPEASLGYLAMANVYSREYNWIEVERMVRKAYELNPGVTEISRLNSFLVNHGDEEEALQLVKKALLVDPLSPEIRTNHLYILMRMQRFDEAIRTGNRYLQLDSNNIDLWTILAYPYIGKKEYRKALECWARQHESYGNKELANIYRTADFKTAISTWIEQSKTNKVMFPNHMTRAVAYALIQDKENTLKYIDSAFQAKENGLAPLKTYWLFDFVRQDPRFVELIRKLNFAAFDDYRKNRK